MSMIKDGIGGSNTQTGLRFEARVDLNELLNKTAGYEVKAIAGQAGEAVFFKGELIAKVFKKHAFYKHLDELGIDWTSRLSKQLLPDQALLLIIRNTLFIIEIKFQSVEGSVDEKLQTCDFKRKMYSKLVKGLGLKVEYVYVLNDWFKQPKYRDMLEYIDSVNCHYHFNEIPLIWLGLPSVGLV
jgi:hypothetical protein